MTNLNHNNRHSPSESQTTGTYVVSACQSKTKAVPITQSVFPTMDSTEDVVSLAMDSIESMDSNRLYGLLMIMQNTVISNLKGKTSHADR